jgi:transposase
LPPSMCGSDPRAPVVQHAGRRADQLDPADPTELYHHGVAGAADELRSLAGRQFLARRELPVDARERITVAHEIIDLLDAQLAEIERDLRALARRQTGCQALMTQYGIGEISALVTSCELGDVTRSWASSPNKAPRRCARRSTRPPNRPASALVQHHQHASAQRVKQAHRVPPPPVRHD